MAIKCVDQKITEKFAIYNGDSCEVMNGIPDETIGYSIFSPPFAELYCYSDSERDLGNSKNYDEFFQHFEIIAKELFRVLEKGRNVSVHCIDIPAMKERDGYIGLKDFPGDIIRLFVESGFVYHSRHLIWKDPLIEATRTKAIGLMHKQLVKDSAMSRAGLPDYLLTFRKPGENKKPITHESGLQKYAGSKRITGQGEKLSHNIWRAYASPVWMDIRQTNVLPYKEGREEEDEKHICPLQLDTIERGITLWSNPGDVVLTPFMGVGSECYGAVIIDRKAMGIELKPSYFRQAVKNLNYAENKLIEQNELILPDQEDLFDE